MIRVPNAVAGLVVLAWLLLACAGGATTPPPEPTAPTAAAPPTPTTLPVASTGPARTQLKVGYIASTISAGLFLGESRGYFAEEGLELELEPFDAGERMIPLLATDQIAVAAGGLSAGLYGALARGAELRVIAGMTTNEPGYSSTAIVVRKDLMDSGAIRDLADLRDRSVGLIAPTSSLAIDMSRALQSVGLSDTDVSWVLLPFPDQALALANGAIEVSILTEPFVATAVQTGIGVRWKGMDELYPHHQLTVLMYAPGFARDQPAAAERFLAAYLRGARDFVDAVKHGRDRSGVFRVLAEYTPIKDLSMYEHIVPSGIDPDGRLNRESMEADQDWYLARGYIREKIDLSRVIDLSYREAALQRIGRYTPRP